MAIWRELRASGHWIYIQLERWQCLKLLPFRDHQREIVHRENAVKPYNQMPSGPEHLSLSGRFPFNLGTSLFLDSIDCTVNIPWIYEELNFNLCMCTTLLLIGLSSSIPLFLSSVHLYLFVYPSIHTSIHPTTHLSSFFIIASIFFLSFRPFLSQFIFSVVH
jgi:hypothetical protein